MGIALLHVGELTDRLMKDWRAIERLFSAKAIFLDEYLRWDARFLEVMDILLKRGRGVLDMPIGGVQIICKPRSLTILSFVAP
jgi:hypothetical protein